jgi:hypothetical protein
MDFDAINTIHIVSLECTFGFVGSNSSEKPFLVNLIILSMALISSHPVKGFPGFCHPRKQLKPHLVRRKVTGKL